MRSRNLAVGSLIALMLIPAARANIGPRWWGDVVTEPWGLKEIAIVHEQLTIDLRPLLNADPIYVEVTYYLFNTGNAKKLGLLFVSGEAGVSEFEASLNGQAVAAQVLSRLEARRHWARFPDGWQPPIFGPGFEHEKLYHELRDKESAVPVSFDLDLPTGLSTLRVRYLARACGADEGKPVVTWQFPYVLSPARDWGSFGKLDVTVLVPDGWEAKSTPALEWADSTLSGHFTGLPADALVVATRTPVPEAYRQNFGYLGAGYALVWLLGGVACWRAGRWLGRYVGRSEAAGEAKRAQIASLTLLPLSGIAWAGIVFVSGTVVAPWILTPSCFNMLHTLLHVESRYARSLMSAVSCNGMGQPR